jgi:hypothetical protein
VTQQVPSTETLSKEPLPLGTVVKPWGKIGAILLTAGERYYLLHKGKDVAMMPAGEVERVAS